MTAAKIESKLAASAAAGLEPWIAPLYATPGKRIIGVVELRHAERTQPAPDEDKEPKVGLRVTHLEIAHDEQEEPLRNALRALYLHRTASGTLTEDGELELTDQALRLVGDNLHALEAARLRAGMQLWRQYARNAAGLPEDSATVTSLREELRTLADGLDAILYAASDGEG